MGSWVSRRCSDCGERIPEPTLKQSRAFFVVGSPKRIICAECWIKPRVHPTVGEFAIVRKD